VNHLRGEHRRHRGAHPKDQRLFDAALLPTLRGAVADLSWLLSRGYAAAASLKLVGDRFELKERQRLAVARAACSDQQKESRELISLPIESVRGQDLLIDGFNIIVTTEAALSGGVLIHCRDGCVRDMSSVHGSYRSGAGTRGVPGPRRFGQLLHGQRLRGDDQQRLERERETVERVGRD